MPNLDRTVSENVLCLGRVLSYNSPYGTNSVTYGKVLWICTSLKGVKPDYNRGQYIVLHTKDTHYGSGYVFSKPDVKKMMSGESLDGFKLGD